MAHARPAPNTHKISKCQKWDWISVLKTYGWDGTSWGKLEGGEWGPAGSYFTADLSENAQGTHFKNDQK